VKKLQQSNCEKPIPTPTVGAVGENGIKSKPNVTKIYAILLKRFTKVEKMGEGKIRKKT